MESMVLTLPTGPITNLGQYVHAVERYPLIGADEERRLAHRLRRDDDLEAAWRLVSSHLRYVVRIARGYAGYGLPQEDLIQEGNVGLMKAVKRFDPSYGVRLVVYAAYWIRAEIHDFIQKNWRIVRLGTTKAKRKLFYKLRAAKKRLEWLNKAEAEEVASELDVNADDVVDMEAKLYLPDMPFDGAMTSDDATAPALYLQDNRFDPEALLEETECFDQASSALREALEMLDDRSRDIVEGRWLIDGDKKRTLTQLGRKYGISAERVRQIEATAIKQVREFVVSKLGPECGTARLPRLESALTGISA
jgi:RNA polymerase sigma-32 factor